MITRCLLLLALTAMQTPVRADQPKESAKEIFGTTKVHEIHLQINAQDWQNMQPTGGGMRFGPPGGGSGGPGGFGGPPQPPANDANTDVHRGHGFGMSFPWAHADLTAGDKTYKNVGIRFKGNASYMASSRGLKRNFKIDFNHFEEAQDFHGLKSINLNAGAMDPTKGHEALSYSVFRAAGVPAPRTAFAVVTLTIPGKYEKEFLGVYTLVEQVSKTFLKDHFKNAKGLLLKPEGVRGLEYLGEEWAAYERRYNAKTDADKKERQRLIEFTRLIHRGSDEEFRKEIGKYLDIDEFLRFVAVNALVSNLDSIFMMGHNYYIYLPTETSKFVFMPWDLDLSLAGFPMGGGPDQQADLSVIHPFAGENKLFDRLMAMKDVSEKYQVVLKELATTCFTKEKLLKEVDAIERVTKEPMAKEKAAAEKRNEGPGVGPPPGRGPGGPGGGPPPGGPGGPGGMFGRGLDLRTFVTKRAESVAAQLAGKSKGFVPTMGFGPGMMAMPRVGDVFPPPLQQMLQMTDAQKKQLADLQKDVDAKLDKILNDEQRKQIKQMRERPLGPPGGGPGGPPGFGPPGGPPPVIDRLEERRP